VDAHNYFPSHVFLGEWRWVVVAAAQLAAVALALGSSHGLS
jgi:hypothetical protein